MDSHFYLSSPRGVYCTFSDAMYPALSLPGYGGQPLIFFKKLTFLVLGHLFKSKKDEYPQEEYCGVTTTGN